VPVFLPLATLISSLVGYQLPVFCQSLAQGSTLSANVTISVGGQQVSASGSVQLPNDALGVTVFYWLPAGSTATVSAGGQTETLPTIPGDTPQSHEASPPPYPLGLTPVSTPAFIAIDQSLCDGWTRDDPAQRGVALLAAIHESMHAHYADGNEALTECRALKMYPTVLQSLFPSTTSPGPAPTSPGAAPLKPALVHETAAWKRSHAQAWKRILARWKQATGRWQQSYSQWQQAQSQWQQAYNQWSAANDAWNKQSGEETAMTSAAQASDATLPAPYHGATC
jgi:hypothetical protein